MDWESVGLKNDKGEKELLKEGWEKAMRSLWLRSNAHTRTTVLGKGF